MQARLCRGFALGRRFYSSRQIKYFTLPGDSLGAVTFHKWHVKQGDSVNEADKICTIESDKVVMDITAEDSRKITQLFKNEAENIANGDKLYEYVSVPPFAPEKHFFTPSSQTNKPPKRKIIRKIILSAIGLGLLYELYMSTPISNVNHPNHPTLITPLQQTIEGGKRFMKTGIVMAQIGIDYKLNFYDALPKDEKSRIHKRNAERLLDFIHRLGGVYVKIGQYLSTMTNVLPTEWTQTMLVLQDKAPTVPLSDLQYLFIKHFGKTTTELYTDFDSTPIAAASLAQVHRATVDGKQVAVKIQYPSITFNFYSDKITRDMIFALIPMLFPKYDSSWIGPELSDALHREMDFMLEIQNMKRAKRLFGDRQDVYIPQVVDSLSCSQILTMEFINGVKISDVDAIERMGLSVKDASQTTFEAFAEMTFKHGFLHTDPHAGNIFVRPNPNNPKRTQVVILDHGLYRELDDEFRTNYAKLWKALILKDNKVVKEYCQKYGIDDYELYGAIVLMRSYNTAEIGMISHHTMEEAQQFMDQYFEHIGDSVLNILNKMPHEMLLVMRTNSILRALNHELGVPVNRHIINARVAAQSLEQESGWKYFKFNMMLKYYEIKQRVIVALYRIAIYLHLMKPIILNLDRQSTDVILAA